MLKHAHIIGWGRYLPDRILTNEELSKTVDTNDEWIRTRTGIRQRYIAESHETTATLAFEAAARALEMADVPPAEVDLIIVATSTPEYTFPSTACRVQDYLGASEAGAFDLSAACSGFVYGLEMATQAIASGSITCALVVGAETMSRALDWTDRATCILFGDGAGAVVLKGSSVPGGVICSTLRSDGSGAELLMLPAGQHNAVPVLGPDFDYGPHLKNTIRMNGRQVFRFAVRVIVDSINEVIKKGGLTLDDIDLIIPHQANVRIIETAAKKLRIAPEKFFLNVAHVGNTSAASIPLALCDAIDAGRLSPDMNVIMVGFGGGLTWGATLVKWDVTPLEGVSQARQWRRMRYVAARTRSKYRQWQRKVLASLSGSPTPDARLRDADKKDPDRKPGGD